MSVSDDGGVGEMVFWVSVVYVVKGMDFVVLGVGDGVMRLWKTFYEGEFFVSFDCVFV